MKKLRLFEMFAGYGGASFALKKAKIPFECVGYSEIDKNAIHCFQINHGGHNFGDCSKIDLKDLPDFDLLTGGFPCQDVSIAGSRDLSKGRTNLYLEIIRIAKEKKPQYMLLENVKGLLSVEVDEVKLVQIIVRDLQKIGYGVCWKVLNSKDYGIPQNRERIWFVCKLGGWDFMEFQFPNTEELKIFLKDVLESGEVDRDVSYCIDANYFKGTTLKGYLEKCRRQIVFEKGIVLPNATKKGYVYGHKFDGVKLEHPKSKTNRGRVGRQISPCIACASTPGVILEDYRIRKLTPKECFRLMGFLDDEINLDGLSDTQKYKLSGNGWDINLVSKIFKNMLK